MKINLASFRIAFTLIAILFIFILLSAVIPQKDIAVGQVVNWQETLGDYYKIIETLKLDQIYTTPYFFILLGLLAVNLIAGNIKRFKIIHKTEKTLLKTRHIGSIVFHFSLILVMSGVILNYLYKFEGLYGITEGQTVIDNENSYKVVYSGPGYSKEYGQFNITLDSISVTRSFDDGDYSSDKIFTTLKLTDNIAPIKVELSTNHPFDFNDLSLHYGMVTGYSPKLIFTDTNKNEILNGIVRLAYSSVNGTPRHYDYIFIEDEGLRISVEVLTDEVSIKQPKFKVIVDSHSALLYEGIVKPGDMINFEKYNLEIPEFRHWCNLTVKNHPFLNLIFFGFWMGIAGMTLMFISRIAKDKS